MAARAAQSGPRCAPHVHPRFDWWRVAGAAAATAASRRASGLVPLCRTARTIARRSAGSLCAARAGSCARDTIVVCGKLLMAADTGRLPPR